MAREGPGVRDGRLPGLGVGHTDVVICGGQPAYS